MTPTIVKTECPVCGPSDTAFVGECHNNRVVRCVSCQLMFVGECQSVEETKDFFRTDHVEDRQTTERHYVDWRKDSLEREAAIVKQLRPKGGRLLDVGTASGYFLRKFADHPEWHVEGVEPSAVSARFAEEEFGLKVHQGYLAEQNYANNTFDVVTSLDAFNCHRTPNEDLLEIIRITKPGGYFAIEIPGQNYRMLTGSGMACRLMFGTSLRLNAGVNFYFYTTDALVTMASRVGFVLQKSYPEAMPTIGNIVARATKAAYFAATAAAYRISAGKVNYAPKEFLVFQKPES